MIFNIFRNNEKSYHIFSSIASNAYRCIHINGDVKKQSEHVAIFFTYLFIFVNSPQAKAIMPLRSKGLLGREWEDFKRNRRANRKQKSKDKLLHLFQMKYTIAAQYQDIVTRSFL